MKNKRQKISKKFLTNLPFPKKSQTKAAMEMSVGTIVTIVLLMSVLVLGIFLVQKIFKTGTTAIDSVDTKIQSEIDNLFATDEGAKFSAIPKERIVTIKKGDSGGFGFSVTNKLQDTATFAYEVSLDSVASNCQMTETQAENLIVLGKQGERTLGSGQSFDDAVFVRFSIPETAPLCLIDYFVDVTADGEPYTGFAKTIEIK